MYVVAGGLNPFEFRASVQTDLHCRVKPSVCVSIPLNSGRQSRRASSNRLRSRPVSIPLNSGRQSRLEKAEGRRVGRVSIPLNSGRQSRREPRLGADAPRVSIPLNSGRQSRLAGTVTFSFDDGLNPFEFRASVQTRTACGD